MGLVWGGVLLVSLARLRFWFVRGQVVVESIAGYPVRKSIHPFPQSSIQGSFPSMDRR